jgi:glutamyl-tRNA reductase
MYYLLISFSHKNTNITVRDKISFSDNEVLKTFMQQTKAYTSEIMVLNTCNRIEFFLTTTNTNETVDNMLHDLAHFSEVSYEDLKNNADIFYKEMAIHHLFAVISSLESLVIGETQIVGQIKDAFQLAFENGFAGQKISRAIHYGFRCSAAIRNNTSISKSKVSIASVAVSKAETIYQDLNNISALVIGSGEMSRLVAQYLNAKGANVILINRTREKAEAIADEVKNIEVQDFSELKNLINQTKLVFTSTSSEEPIIKCDMIENTNFKRVWFDLAVPKDIEDSTKKEIVIYRIDDLQDTVKKNIENREIEIKSSYKIVGEFTKNFFNWINSLSVDPLIKEIYLKAQDSVADEVARAIKKGFISQELESNVEKIAMQSLKKFLHGMSKKLKKISNEPSSDTVIESINYLFDLQNSDNIKLKNVYKCEYSIGKGKDLTGLKK